MVLPLGQPTSLREVQRFAGQGGSDHDVRVRYQVPYDLQHSLSKGVLNDNDVRV